MRNRRFHRAELRPPRDDVRPNVGHWVHGQLMLEATVEALVAGQHPPSEGRFVSGEGLSSPSMRSRSSLPAERWAAHRAVQCRGRGVRSLTRPLRMSGTFVDRRSTMGAVRSHTASSTARASRWNDSLRPPRNDRRGRNEMLKRKLPSGRFGSLIIKNCRLSG